MLLGADQHSGRAFGRKVGCLVATGMKFGLLGPLTVRRGGAEVPVPAGKQRVVLATLLLNANRLVPLDELAEALWGPGPPPSARATMQNYVMRLRKSLGDSRIATQPGGYLISADPGDLDVSRFETLLGSARAAARGGLWEQAADQARTALALWRGEPLADVDSELLALREKPRLAELRLQALETRIDADLNLGQAGEVVGELRHLAGAHPLREHFHGLLMLALYRDGRQGEALAAYQHARRVLIDELGTEPGTELRELHQRILTADPALDAPEFTRPAAAGRTTVVPRELPCGIRDFTGRESELAALSGLLDQQAGDDAPPTMVVSAIGGTAGVGKTALALHWAHQMTDRFPDGQLYVNLRGYDPGQPMPATDALAGFLRALGVPGPDIPAEEDERAARYRSLLAGKRVLVVLDNAGDVEQVRPLLPGSPGCAVMVTSRDALAGLIARDGAARLDLDLLPLPDAVSLLRALIGSRVDTDPEAATALATRCCRLPLALRVAAELAAVRPQIPLADLSSELADQQQRLDVLDVGGDPRTAVRAVFSWSYRHLDPEAARAFRLAGLHPGADFDPCAVAALTATTAAQGRRLLEVLARAHLVQPGGAGRYGMHDLLRAYAAEHACVIDTGQQRHAALTSLLDYYSCAAAGAMDALHPAERQRRPQPPVPARPVPPPPAPAAARDWLDAERASLVAVTTCAADNGWPRHAVALAGILSRHLRVDGHSPDAQAVFTAGLRAAQQTGDLAGQAQSLRDLGVVETWHDHHSQAVSKLQSALDLHRQIGDPLGQAQTLHDLGIVAWRQGRSQEAVGHWRQALALSRDIDDRLGEGRALINLGNIATRQGDHEQAADRYREALAIFREIGDKNAEAIALDNLGELLCRQGDYQQAEDHLGQALPIFRELGNRHGEADVLQNLAYACRGQGRCQAAAGYCQQALAIFGEVGDRSGEAEALNSLGEALSGAGLPGQARAHHHDALTLARQIGARYELARAHNGLAVTYHATGDHGRARRHWQQAFALYTELAAPEATQVRAHLTAAAGAGPGEPHAPAGQSG
jgi:DNA-binding SARP family transcriptional activator/tetratricopeptide (TPR) repeat protein